jgi:uncharacterized protein YegP (UPF0339 family)
MHFDVIKVPRASAEPQWDWKLINDSGATAAYGEGYRSKLDCEHAIVAVKALEMDTPINYVEE